MLHLIIHGVLPWIANSTNARVVWAGSQPCSNLPDGCTGPSRDCARPMAHSMILPALEGFQDATRCDFQFTSTTSSLLREVFWVMGRPNLEYLLGVTGSHGHEPEVVSGYILEALWGTGRHLQMVESTDGFLQLRKAYCTNSRSI